MKDELSAIRDSSANSLMRSLATYKTSTISNTLAIYPRLENPKPRPLEPSLNQVGEACIDVPNWNVTTIGATCEQFYFKRTNTTVSCDE